SMGPGLLGQLVEMRRTDPGSVRSCLACHAPLAEQAEQLEGPRGLAANPSFDIGLPRQGLVCAGCHVRHQQRFGPPPRPDASARRIPRSRLPQDGASSSASFLRSEFCASCPQSEPTDLRLNGKLLENTYAEWKASPAARQGLECQSCHMPDRRHLWRGIHDPDMVRSGVEISLGTDRPHYWPGDQLRAALSIRSVRVGHHFPTYVTRRVLVRAELIGTAGQTVPESVEERAIGRD